MIRLTLRCISARVRRAALVAALLLLHAALLAWCGFHNSPTPDEFGHLPAGISHWHLGRFNLYCVNPPLVRMVASLPVVLAMPKTNWVQFDAQGSERPEWQIGRHFWALNADRALWYFRLARWACIPLIVCGGYFCYRWAAEVYGVPSGILALVLWCFCPNVIANGAMITPDAGATALGIAGCYAFWRWLKEPDWLKAFIAGVSLGLVQLTKSTWIVLFGIWPLLWLASRAFKCRTLFGPKPRTGTQLAIVLLLRLYVLNLGYGFEGSFQRLREFSFVSRTLTGHGAQPPGPETHGNRFRDHWVGYLPVPLPMNYVTGIDIQKRDFERGMWSYLGGEHRHGGWWYYYLYALVIKTPLGTVGLVLIAVVVTLANRAYRSSCISELAFFLPVAVILGLVSTQTGFNRYLRYVLPILPFIFIWASKVARSFPLEHRGLTIAVCLCTFWTVASSLSVFPHCLSYFNELAGGPTRGHAHLIDANIDWGQDLLYLKRWLDRHSEARPLHLAYYGPVDPRDVGIDYKMAPEGPASDSRMTAPTRHQAGPQPGWHAISVNRLRSRTNEYSYFLYFRPVAMAGYSIYIYDISLVEANRVRRELGLTDLVDEAMVEEL